MQRLLGDSLQVTEAGLALRQRSGSLPNELATTWQKFKANRVSLSPVLREARYQQFRGKVRGLVAHVGDTSNLILDPDLDSYYLMDATLLGVTRLQDRLTELRLMTSKSFSKPELTTADLLNLFSTARLLREADFDGIVTSARTALAEDPNFHGPSATMRQIEPALEAFIGSMEALFGQIDISDAAQATERGTEIDQCIVRSTSHRTIFANPLQPLVVSAIRSSRSTTFRTPSLARSKNKRLSRVTSAATSLTPPEARRKSPVTST